MNENFHRIAIKGGISTPSELKKIIDYAKLLNLSYLHLGSRQDIIFPDNNNEGELLEDLQIFDQLSFTTLPYQNITCSYVAIDIFNSTHWLRGTSYLYLLEQFRYQPILKISICDPQQQLVPLFHSHLNFLASNHEDYWYLFLKLPGIKEQFYPVLIYTWDLAEISQLIEKMYIKVRNVEELFEHINKSTETNNRNIEKPLQLDFKPFPYYEGMNKMKDNNYWLGLYWRNNQYDLDFLTKLCDFCLEFKIGKICLTPWKSIIIKNIPKKSKLPLEKLLGQSGINIRHSSLELNWHLPIGDQKALDLKKFLVLNFDQNDISTYGITFSIYTDNQPTSFFTSVVILENQIKTQLEDIVIRPTYTILYSEDFDPNTQKYQVFAQDIDKMNLPGVLIELTKMYFQNLGNTANHKIETNSKLKEPEFLVAYQCKACLNIYDPSYGEPEQQIEKGTAFENLPENFKCNLCGETSSSFEKMKLPVSVSS